MKRFPRKKLAVFIAAVLLAAAAVAIADRRYHFCGRALFAFEEWRHARQWRGKSVWLPDYRAVLEAVPVESVDQNLSGLTWNGDTGTLFAVVNHPPRIVELSTDGGLLRGIELRGFRDPEAIEYIGEGRYIVADERAQRLVCIAIDAETREIDAKGFQRLTLGMGETGNRGLEGLAWDFSNQKLYAAKEKNPVHIYEVAGFPQAPGATMDIEVTNDKKRDVRLFVRDVSSLDFNRRYGHLLVLSDESRIVLEIDPGGRPISSLPLTAGQGLARPIPQPEGIAMDDKDNLYLVSEPNLFYAFRKTAN